MPLAMTVEALDLRDVFLFFLDNIGISTYYKEIMAMTLSLVFLAPRISLVVLVFLAILTLISRRLLMLVTKFVNKKSVSGLSHYKVVPLLFCQLVPLEILLIDLTSF